MPIRLNLLAEAQAIEEMRRSNPVKRAIWVAALLISLMLVWSSSLQLKSMMANRGVNRLEGEMNSHSNAYQVVMVNQKKIEEIGQKLAALHRLTTNRFLNATLLNALQQTTVDDVQMIRIRADQTYAYIEETRARTNSSGNVVPARPGTVTEKVVLTLEGTDSSANPGDQVNRFKEALIHNTYFLDHLGKTNEINLKALSQPQFSTALGPNAGKASVQFTLECRYPEKTR